MNEPQPPVTPENPGRRRFLKLPLAAGAIGAVAYAAWARYGGTEEPPRSAPAAAPRKPVLDEYDEKNLKLAHRVSSTLTDDEILFLKQIGLRWMRVEFRTEESSLDAVAQVQKRFEKHGIKIFSGMHPAYRSLKIQLGQKGRDADIETYQTFVRSLGKLGIPVANYDFHPGNTYTTATVQRRGYSAREFNLDDFRKKVEKPRFDREYSADEIWDSYTYFVKAVLPVAEQAGVKLGLHPDDPPVAKMNGVAKLFTHYDGYRRAEEIAGRSKHWGLTFCVGTWSEGGERMGKNVLEMIQEFGGRGKILDVHFRNVSAPLPHFVETFRTTATSTCTR
jgi:mannonate dehydratase